MNLFELFAINISFLCFPIILYIIFITFKKRFKKGEKDIILEIILYFVTFLLIYLYTENDINRFVCCLTLPIYISFIYHKTKTSIIISIIDLFFMIYYVRNNIVSLIILFIMYFIFYSIYFKTSKTIKYISKWYIISTLLYILSCVVYYNEYNIRSIGITVFFLSIALLIKFMFEKVSKLLETYKTLNEYKKDNDLRVTISKLSHEVKNPLIIIKGYLDIMNKDNFLKAKECLINEVNYSLDVLNDFKQINNINIVKKYFSYNKIIKNIKNEIIPIYINKKIKVKFKTQKNIKIYADDKRIKQVLVNIIKNSIEASNVNGIINIESKIFLNNLIIKIKDNKKGMNKDELDNIFTPFYTKKEYGSGLGLCLSKEIIEGHNGTITYFSKINKYTEAKICIPINNNKDNN